MGNKRMKPYFSTMAILFFISIATGYLAAVWNIDEARRIVGELSSTYGFLKDLNPFLTFVFIFLNNSVKSLFMVVFGFFFGLVPLFFIISNGQILGIVIATVQSKISMGAILLSLLVHGIFEIPAVIIASGYGLWLGNKFYRMLRHKEQFRDSFKISLGKFWRIVVPLLLIAAFIETFITPYVLEQLK